MEAHDFILLSENNLYSKQTYYATKIASTIGQALMLNWRLVATCNNLM